MNRASAFFARVGRSGAAPAACLILFLSPGSSALAACFGDAGTPLFRCAVNNGATEVRVCLQGDTAYYAYGPLEGAPDLVLARHVRDVDMHPWPGIGRTIWDSLAIYNGAYEYRVTQGMDKVDQRVFGDVSVSRDGTVIAELSCDPETMSTGDFYPLYLAKEAAGQCWESLSGTWSPC